MFAYYNDNDPFAAAWLRELMKAGVIPDGYVDDRSITDVEPDDLAGFTQCHFFAGIGGWAYALELASWPAHRSVWTGSCPCQPFSAAGNGASAADSRHLWPTWFRLIRECRPVVVFGEQVASADGLAWFDAVSTDLEGTGYAVGAVDLCAASVGAPHIRQRLWFVADELALAGWESARRRDSRSGEGAAADRTRPPDQLGRSGATDDDGLGHADDARSQGRHGAELSERAGQRPGDLGLVGHADRDGHELGWLARHTGVEGASRLEPHRSTPWDDHRTILCRDGKLRIVKPGIQPLAHGVSARVGRLRGYGNAIVPPVAAEVIAAYLELGRGETIAEETPR